MTVRDRLRSGLVIPAHPLALTRERKLDEKRQRALTRYYLAAGAGGVALGVHTTQFEIHDAAVGLYRPVLELAVDEVRRFSGSDRLAPVKVAGLVGKTSQATREIALAHDLGYDCGLLSLGAMRDASDTELIEHARAVAEVIPLFGFYLQPSVGGRILGFDFWRRFAEIENVVAIKIAPFNRYSTIDVIRAVAESGRSDIALYTGNDDNIVLDLLTAYRFPAARSKNRKSDDPTADSRKRSRRHEEADFYGKSSSASSRRRLRRMGSFLNPACDDPVSALSQVERRIVGGLLGQWAVWTKR